MTHRDEALAALEGDEGVVGLGSAGGGVDDDVDDVVEDGLGAGLCEHGLDVGGAEDCLEGLESEARELGLDEVGAVLHDDGHFRSLTNRTRGVLKKKPA